MADDRPVDTTVDQLATLQSDFDDFRTSMLARAARRPTGTTEVTLLPAAKADTLLLNGAVVSRATYAGLWQWAQDNSLVIAGMFTVGDGSTTFGLPDLRGRVLVMAGTLGSDTYAVGGTGGASTKTIATANMPSHSHTLTINSVGDHSHGGSGALADGTHGGHNSGFFGIAAGGDGGVASNGDTGNGNHNHTLSLSGDGGHTHTGTAAAIGSGTPLDTRPAYIVANMIIWT